MTEGLGDFFKLIAENKQEVAKQKQQIAEQKEQEEQVHIDKIRKEEEIINAQIDMGLDDIFEQLGVQPKKERTNKKHTQIVSEEKQKKEEFDKLISSVVSIGHSKTVDIVETVEEEESVQEPKISKEEKEQKVLTFLESFLTNKIDDIEEIKQEIVEEEETPEKPEGPSLIEKSLGLLSEPSDNKMGDDPLTPLDQNFVTLSDLQNHYRSFLTRIQQQLGTLGGGGEVRLEFLDDVDRDSVKVDGKYLKYQASTGKFIGADASGGGGGSGITTAEVRDAIQGYYGYETDYYTVGVANTSQEIGAGTTTMILPQVASVFQALPTIMTGIGTNPYVGTGATVGTGQTEFSFAGLTSGASCIVRTALAFNPDEDNTNLDIQLKFTTNTATQAAGTTNFTILKEQALIMNEGADQQYISESVFSFFIGSKLEGTTYDNSGSFNIEVIPTNGGELEVLAVTVNVVA